MKKSDYINTLRNELTAGTLSKSILERIAYTVSAFDKNAKSVDVPTLVDLKRDIDAESKITVPELVTVVEAEIKPKAKPAKKPAKPTKKPEDAVPEVKTEKPKAKKPAEKKVDKPVIETDTESTASGLVPFAKFFPDTLDIANLGKFKKRSDILTHEAFREAVDGDTNVVIAMYWSPRMITKYEYSAQYRVAKVKKFADDLDIVTPVMFLDKETRVLCVSAYTDAIVPIEENDFEYIEDSNGKDKYQVRLSHGVEFELYSPISE